MSEEDAGSLIENNVIYLVLLAIFFIPILFFVKGQMNGAGVFSDYYAKEIVRQINLAEPGDKISFNVQEATNIAVKNSVSDLNETFSFDEVNNEACVKLSPNTKTCYSYFSDIRIRNNELRLGVPENVLVFEVEKK